MMATKMTCHLKTVRSLNGSICLAFKYYQTNQTNKIVIFFLINGILKLNSYELIQESSKADITNECMSLTFYLWISDVF